VHVCERGDELAVTGMRRGECLGLRVRDLHLDASPPHIEVRQTVTLVDGEIRVADRTKTDEPREVRLDEETVELLREHLWERARSRVAGVDELNARRATLAPDAFVFPAKDGGPMNPEWFSREFRRAIERVNRPDIGLGLRPRRLHDLRHLHATEMLRLGVPLADVAERLGHSEARTTLDVYGHPTDDAEDVAMARWSAARSAARDAG